MLAADAIGKFVYDGYIVPAHERGEKTITVRASEVYWGLNRRYDLDLICSVLGSVWLCDVSGLALERIDYPESSSRMATFKFRVDPSLTAAVRAASRFTKQGVMTSVLDPRGHAAQW